MKVVVYGPMNRFGFLVDGKVVDGQAAVASYLVAQGEPHPMEMATAVVGSDLQGFITGGERALETARKALAHHRDNSWKSVMMVWDAKNVRLKAPLVNSNTVKVMCAGANYASHIAAGRTMEQTRADALKETAWGFYKMGGNIVGDGDPLPYPGRTQRLDYEGEIAIVFGKGGKDISKSSYLEHVFGVTLMNDMSIRDGLGVWDRQGMSMTFQFMKNFEGAGVLGPCIVTRDEIPNPEDVDFVTKVNGEVRQRSNSSQMIRTFGDFTQILSTDVVFYPGDIISGGTPSGTVMDSNRRTGPDGKPIPVDPKFFLKIGDVVEVSSPQVGMITNKIVAKGMD